MAQKSKRDASKSAVKVTRTQERKEARRMDNLARQHHNAVLRSKGLPTVHETKRQARAEARANDPAVKARKAAHEQARAKELQEAKIKNDKEAQKRKMRDANARLVEQAVALRVIIDATR